MKRIGRFICAVMVAVLALQSVGFAKEQAFADAAAGISCFPEAGSRTKTDSSLTVDYSHMDQGYVMVKTKKTEKRVQLAVLHGTEDVHYELNGDGRYETIPLQFGSGTYQFTLFVAQKKGSKHCKKAGALTLKCRMADETSCFRYPNQYVSYSVDSPFVAEARELCTGLSEAKDIATAICDYVSTHFCYDFLRAGTIQTDKVKNLLPDLQTTWETKKGICQDLSALTCAMLRSQGVAAKLAIGRADGKNHSWVVIMIDGKAKRFDPSFSARSYQAERYY